MAKRTAEWTTADVREGASMDTNKTIMVVDDNPDIITIVKTILEGGLHRF